MAYDSNLNLKSSGVRFVLVGLTYKCDIYKSAYKILVKFSFFVIIL
jgi:hypothetical protein